MTNSRSDALSLRPRVLRASAGSGKTFQLSSRFLQLLLLGEDPDKILATTFTRKAAGEISARIFKRLSRGAADAALAAELSAELGLPRLQPEKVRDTLRRLIDYQHRLSISTLDTFFSSIAKSFSAELGLPAHWKLQDPAADRDVMTEVSRLLCLKEGAALSQILERIYGPGGRSRVHSSLMQKIKILLQLAHAAPTDAWRVNFECQAPAAAALSESIQRLSRFRAPLTKTQTPNKRFQASLIKMVKTIDAGGCWEEGLAPVTLFQKIIKKEETYSQGTIDPELCEICEPIIQQVRYRILELIKERTAALESLQKKISSIYEGVQASQGLVPFDDLKRLIYQGAVGSNLVELFFRIDSKIKHILLDEFQDTSLNDWRLLDPIVDEILAHSDGSHSFFCVGDTKQAIYGFRGGVAEIFDSLESRWSHLDVDHLEVSYRSSQTVLDYVNHVFVSIDQNPALQGLESAASQWKKRFNPHSAVRTALPGFVSFTHIDKNADDDSPDTITSAADEIKRLLSVNPKLKIGMLLRKNRLAGRCLYELAERGIPAAGEGGAALSDSPVVAVTLSLLWFIDHPGDLIAHRHVASSPLGELIGLSENDSLQRRDEIAARLRRIYLEEGILALLKEISKATDTFSAPRDKARMLQLIESAIIYSSSTSQRLSCFVNYIRPLKVAVPDQSNVTVMTIHNSKGLEFDAVFLCDLGGLLSGSQDKLVSVFKDSPLEGPSQIRSFVKAEFRWVDAQLANSYERIRAQEILNELSVLYVALTRAKYGLYLYGDAAETRNTAAKLLAHGIRALPVYESGNRNWAAAIEMEDGENLTETIPSMINFAPEDERSVRHLARLTGSRKHSFFNFSIAGEKARKARDFGLVLHRLFEGLEWIEETGNFEAKPEIFSWGAQMRIPRETIEAALQEFTTLISDSDFCRHFSRQAYSEWGADSLKAVRERRFSTMSRRGLEVGAIDRLVLGIKNNAVSRIEIIDFKTDADPGKHYEFHAEQVKFYRQAVSDIYTLSHNEISAKLVYLRSRAVQEVK